MRRLLGALASGAAGLVLLCVAIGIVYQPDPGPLRLRRDTVDVGGTRLGYHRTGSGPDVVLLHGGMGSAEDFEPVLAWLAGEFRVTAVDRPGFGLSLAPGDAPTYPGNVRLVGGLLRALGLSRPILVGHSHGGGVALGIAEAHPELVRGLVLLAPAAYPGEEATLLDRVLALPFFGEGVAALAGRRVGPGMIAGILGDMLGPDAGRVPPDFVAFRQALWTAPRSLATHSRQATSDRAGLTAISARLGVVRVPSVVVACSADPTEGEGVDSRRLARELPGSTLWWLEGCGHYVQYAHPETVVAAVRTIASR